MAVQRLERDEYICTLHTNMEQSDEKGEREIKL